MSIRDEQLSKIALADLRNFDEKTNTYYIPKYNRPRFYEGKIYIIQIANELINNPNSVYITNWNQNRVLKNKYYRIVVNRIKGNMIQFEGLAIDYENNLDLNDRWSGWLPMEGVKQLHALS